ncbi:hypothetical protein F5884DRAFT_549406 [Xylogone sp. PMI_703]|nr:hypothetical protein F5884DRAFT_549406 [Xylogone sp. PMI_703]
MDDTSSSSASPSGDSDPQQDARQRLRRQRASELVMNAWQNCYLKIRTYSQSGPKRKLANWARVVVVRTTIALTILCLIILLWQPHSRAHAFLPEQRFDTEGQLADGLRRWDEDFARSVVPISCSDKDHALPYPLFSALAAGCTGVEVDVWLTEDDDLAVEQNVSEFHPSRTLRTLYLQPLLEILSRENPDEQWANHTVYDRARGVFHTHPNTTLTILINVKTDPQKTWKVVNAQLEALRAKQFLARFHVIHTAPGFQEKQDMWPGPVTIVGTGNMDRNAYYEYGTSRPNIQVDGYSISEHYEYHDYFYDAPLDMIPYGNLFTQGVINGQSWTGSTQLYHADEAYYASTSFKKAIGSVRLGFSQKQLNAVREQIYIAKKSGLKSRYYDLPSWPTNYRDYIWDILTKEGVDMLTVDDLESVAKRGWSIGYTRSIVWMTLVSVWLFSMSVIALWVVSRMFRTYFHAVSVSPMLLKPRNFAILQHSISTWNDLKKSDNMVFSDWIDTIIASFALWSTKCILFQYRYYYRE